MPPTATPTPTATPNGPENRARLLQGNGLLLHVYFKAFPLKQGVIPEHFKTLMALLAVRWGTTNPHSPGGSAFFDWLRNIRSHMGVRFSVADGFIGLNGAEILGLCDYDPSPSNPCVVSVQNFLASRVPSQNQTAVRAAVDQFNRNTGSMMRFIRNEGLALRLILVPFHRTADFAVDSVAGPHSVAHVVGLTSEVPPSSRQSDYELLWASEEFGSQPVMLVSKRELRRAGWIDTRPEGPRKCDPIVVADAPLKALLLNFRDETHWAHFNDYVRYPVLQGLWNEVKRVGLDLSYRQFEPVPPQSGIFLRRDVDVVREYLNLLRTQYAYWPSRFRKVALTHDAYLRWAMSADSVPKSRCGDFVTVSLGQSPQGAGSFWAFGHSTFPYSSEERAFVDQLKNSELPGHAGAAFIHFFGSRTYSRKKTYLDESARMQGVSFPDFPTLFDRFIDTQATWNPWKSP